MSLFGGIAERINLDSPSQVKEALQRIGIALDKDSPHLPPHARLVWTVWSPKVRAKKGSAKAAPAEKAAV